MPNVIFESQWGKVEVLSLSLSPPRLLLYKDRKVFKRGWIRGTSGRIQPSRNYVSSRDRFRASFVHDRSSTWPPLEPPLSVVDAARGGQDRYAPRARSRCRCYYRSFFSLRTSAVSCDFPRSIRCGQVRVSYFQYSSILVILLSYSIVLLIQNLSSLLENVVLNYDRWLFILKFVRSLPSFLNCGFLFNKGVIRCYPLVIFVSAS